MSLPHRIDHSTSIPTSSYKFPMGNVSPPLPHRIDHSSSVPTSSYEFPNGYSLSVTAEKFKLTEGLFNAGSANIKVVRFMAV